MTTRAPVETKVVAGAAGAGAGAVISQFVVWLMGCWAWGASWDASKAVDAVAAVPAPVADLVFLTITVIGAWIAGYKAPHTHRTPPVVDPPPVPPLVVQDTALDQLLTETIPTI
jgi:hypothetical protein